MGKIKIINSTFELALRFLAIMEVCDYPLSEYRLRAYSYLCIHLSDISESLHDIHPALPYRSSLFIATQEILHPALHLLIMKGLVECIFDDLGIRYTITQLGSKYMYMICGNYKQELFKAIREVDCIFHNENDDFLRSEIEFKISNWGTEFGYESLLINDEYE